MASFNQSRLHHVVRTWLLTGVIPSVRNANLAEPVISCLYRHCIRGIKLGCSVKSLPTSTSTKLFFDSRHFEKENYLLFLEKSDKKYGNIFIILKRGASDYDQFKSLFHAEIIDYWLSISYKSICPISLKGSRLEFSNINDVVDMANIEVQSLMKCNSLISEFMKATESQGWIFDPLLLGADEWRIDV